MLARLTDRIIGIDRVDQTAVVPQQDVARAPNMVIAIPGLREMRVDPYRQYGRCDWD
jgi:hypothetical protein